MFRSLPPGSVVEANPAQIVSLQRSLNSSPVALNGPMSPARAYIVGVYHQTRGTYSLYVSLRPLERERPGALFCCDPYEVSLDNFRDAEHAALDLVEGHGFVMGALDLRKISPDEARYFFREIPIALPGSSGMGNTTPTPIAGDTTGNVGTYIYTRPKSQPASDPYYPAVEEHTSDGYQQAVAPIYGQAASSKMFGNRSQAPMGFGSSASAPLSEVPISVAPMQAAPPSGRIKQRSSNDELGLPPEEAIAVLGRLLAIF